MFPFTLKGMRILILGGDGYLGWPTAMHLATHGHDVAVADNFFKRSICKQYGRKPLLDPPTMVDRAKLLHQAGGPEIRAHVVDCTDYAELSGLLARENPDAIVHYAEQPSGPWSMIGQEEASRTLNNNLNGTLNLAWAMVEHAPKAQLVKLGTMGEFGTPNIDIPEGWIEIERNGRKDTLLFPRAAGSLYHTTKVLDTDLLWFYVRMYDLAVTDLMQGPVYGVVTPELRALPSEEASSLGTFLHYDDIFGTVINRFLVQALCGVPLTVYGQGGQTRGYLNLIDTVNCIRLACEHPAKPKELRIMNQFTEDFSVNDIAQRVQEGGRELGLDVTVQNLPNPRREAEDHYYKAEHNKLEALGLKPTLMTKEVVVEMLETLLPHIDKVDQSQILPKVKWGQHA